MITLAHLRSLLERALTHTENPAIVRLTDRTVEGVARAYLPHGARVVVTIPAGRAWPQQTYIQTASLGPWLAEPTERSTLDLTDPGTAHALLVALALALGLDPGPLALGCSWQEHGDPRARVIETPNGPEYRSPSPAWALDSTAEVVMFGDPGRWMGRVCPVPALVAGETDPLKALVLAARYVLEHP